MKVTEDEESLVLQVVEEIGERLDQLQSMYRNQEKQDYLAMTLLTYALDNARKHGNDKTLGEIEASADSLLAMLEKVV